MVPCSHQNYGRLEGLVAEQIDHLHYLDDIFSLGIPDLTDVLFLILLQRLLLPLYVYSLTKRHPPATVSDAPVSCLHMLLIPSFLSFICAHIYCFQLLRLASRSPSPFSFVLMR
ncbi:unnamed protein product [Dibothriocephalus latus]|uniref:CLEC16A/TT9 C-terminal domain-containing protein n=1 Tax=Dibothriocephalus latus TaxID=60516 RepID=A0A3P7LJN2_DIBLA|nr:unnamed protein product [Dibothriocephalus latus]